jgi:hypothetical protein
MPTTKGYAIVIEPIFNPGDSVGYVKCYKDGSKWTWKSVGSIEKASKFDYNTANWRSENMQKYNSKGLVLFYPVEI